MDLCRERPSAFFPLWFSQMPTFSHTLFLFCRPASGLPERGCTKLRWMPPKISKEVVESLQPVSAVSGTAALSEYSQIRPNMTFFFFFFQESAFFFFFPSLPVETTEFLFPHPMKYTAVIDNRANENKESLSVLSVTSC